MNTLFSFGMVIVLIIGIVENGAQAVVDMPPHAPNSRPALKSILHWRKFTRESSQRD